MVHLELHIQVSLGDMFRYPRRVGRMLAAKARAWVASRGARKALKGPLLTVAQTWDVAEASYQAIDTERGLTVASSPTPAHRPGTAPGAQADELRQDLRAWKDLAGLYRAAAIRPIRTIAHYSRLYLTYQGHRLRTLLVLIWILARARLTGRWQ